MPPKKVGNRGKPQAPDPDANPASSSAAPAPSPDAPPPSAVQEISSPKLIIPIRVWNRSGKDLVGNRDKQQEPGLEVHPRADPHVHPPPPPSDAPPAPEQSMKPPEVVKQRRRAETRAPPPSAITMSSPNLRRSLRLQGSSKANIHSLGDEAQSSSSSALRPLVEASPSSELQAPKSAKLKFNIPTRSWQKGSNAVVLPHSACKEANADARNIGDFEEQFDRTEYENMSVLIAEVAKGLSGTIGCLKKVALILDEDMLLHEPRTPEAYENPERLMAIICRLKEEEIFDCCDVFKPDEIASRYLLAVYTPVHVEEVKSIVRKSQRQRDLLAVKYDDLYYSQGSSRASLLAAGGVVKACSLIAEGMYRSAFALVRPPGHHAGRNGPSGFCIFNNIAVGAAHLLNKYKMKKILIVDFDIHHGNGTQEIFYDDDRVLFISLHRQDSKFYPFTDNGKVDHIGVGKGRGFNVNICWSHGGMRDVDYIFAWDYLILPIAEEFKPDVILISAGFDAVTGDTLGDCEVTPAGYAILLDKLTRFGPIVLALEGGYSSDPLASSVAACLKVLLGDKSGINTKMTSLPYITTVNAVTEARQIQKPFWKVFEEDIPTEIMSRSIPFKEVVKDSGKN